LDQLFIGLGNLIISFLVQDFLGSGFLDFFIYLFFAVVFLYGKKKREEFFFKM
jgi:hypothetical protein